MKNTENLLKQYFKIIVESEGGGGEIAPLPPDFETFFCLNCVDFLFLVISGTFMLLPNNFNPQIYLYILIVKSMNILKREKKNNYHIYQYFGQLKLKVARFISPLYQFNIWDSKEMYVLFQQTGNCSVTIVVLNISLFGAAIYPNLLKDQPATSGNP